MRDFGVKVKLNPVKELGWGLRTWDQWKFNECDERFGDDWPGRIPAQLIAHTLFYFTKPGDLVLDPTRPPRLKAKPMAGRSTLLHQKREGIQ